mmetsp:Transcript_18050/g.25603  ORF Transcript_18050/g.25603 Transcript_18050/m.25603 type:complete len:516 (+) Transcript_18050:128-1675(+)
MSDAGEEITDDIEGGEFTETEYENLGDRLQSSCAGICIGILLFLGAFPLLYWNEDRAVERYEALEEAEGQVSTVFDPWNIDASNEGKLVHFSVNITNGDNNNGGPTDPIFGISSPDALQIHRQAEMYQWVEYKSTRTTKTAGGGKKKTTTYSYKKQWRDYLVDSYNFQKSGYVNPSSMEFTTETFTADSIKIGAFDLPQELIYRINWDVELDVELENITSEELRGRAVSYDGGYYFESGYEDNNVYNSNEYEYDVNDTSTSTSSNSYSGGVGNAQIGDQRVFFRETPPSIITIVGVQSGGTLGAFVSETGEGGDVLLFKQGNLTSVAMFDAAEQENKIATWLIRFAGFAIMTLGLYLVFRPIEVFADVIPCVGSIIGCGLIFMAVLISSVLSLVTISIAWLAARPEIGAIVLCVSLVVVGSCALGVKKFGKGKKNEDDDFEGVGGKVPGISPNPPPAASVPIVMAVNEPPTVYALPEGQVVASAPQQQPYAYAGSAPPQQQPMVTVSAQPYVPKY